MTFKEDWTKATRKEKAKYIIIFVLQVSVSLFAVLRLVADREALWQSLIALAIVFILIFVPWRERRKR